MARSIISGLLAATVLTLGVVPTLGDWLLKPPGRDKPRVPCLPRPMDWRTMRTARTPNQRMHIATLPNFTKE